MKSFPKTIRTLGVVLLGGLSVPALAAEQDEQLWLQANTHLPLAPGFRVTLEQIARFGDRPGGLFQTEVGALFGYRVAKGVELGTGYRYVGAHNGTGKDEHRLRQQVVGTFGNVSTRFRVDARFHPDGDEIGFRIRPLLRYNQLLDKERKLTLFVSHESFILPNKTDWGQRRGYDRMRNILGLTLPLGREVNADVGYLNQYRPARGSSRAQMDHALSIQLTINLERLLPGQPDD